MDDMDDSKNTEKEQLFIKKASELATESVKKGTGPFGCVITDMDYNMISEGNNQVTEWLDPTAHAEIVAIRRACEKVGTFDLSGTRIFSSCEPCPMCLSAIYWSRIKHVYYGNTREDAANIGFDDAFIYEEFTKEPENRLIQLKRVTSDNSLESFDLWCKNKEKLLY